MHTKFGQNRARTFRWDGENTNVYMSPTPVGPSPLICKTTSALVIRIMAKCFWEDVENVNFPIITLYMNVNFNPKMGNLFSSPLFTRWAFGIAFCPSSVRPSVNFMFCVLLLWKYSWYSHEISHMHWYWSRDGHKWNPYRSEKQEATILNFQ